MRGYVIVACAVLCLSACSSFMHFKDPTLEDIAKDFCDNYKTEHMKDFVDEVRPGISLDDILHAFDVACLLRVKAAGPLALGHVQMDLRQK